MTGEITKVYKVISHLKKLHKAFFLSLFFLHLSNKKTLVQLKDGKWKLMDQMYLHIPALTCSINMSYYLQKRKKFAQNNHPEL